MTKANMDLSDLLAKHDQGDFLRGIAEAVLQLIMESDVDGLIGAGRPAWRCSFWAMRGSWFRVVSRGRFSIACPDMPIRTGRGSITSTGRGSRGDNPGSAAPRRGSRRLLWRFSSCGKQARRRHSVSE